ncbi:ABC transporter permease, partial [Vibrio xuii]
MTAISFVILPAILLSFLLAHANFRGKWFLLSLINTLQAVPTVVIGLLLYMLLSRAGPMGNLDMLFTQKAMVV